MRHGRHVEKLGVKAAHREAMLSNMAASLIAGGRIMTTTSRAKAVQGRVERLVTLAKRGDLHARRQAFSFLRDDTAVKKLFTELASELKERNGGYTRRALFGRRLGDGASLSVVELNIERTVVHEADKKKGKKEEPEAKATKKEAKPEKKSKADKKEKPSQKHKAAAK